NSVSSLVAVVADDRLPHLPPAHTNPSDRAMNRIGLLIPAYNCAATIADVVGGARGHVEHVWVVDDGSTDATAEQATAAGAEVLRQPGNTGKGAALRAGLEWWAARGAEHVLTMDGDGQHLADQIAPLLAAGARGPPAPHIRARPGQPQRV